MRSDLSNELYSPREIALAAGVSEEAILDALRLHKHHGPVSHELAVEVGRAALAQRAAVPAATRQLFTLVAGRQSDRQTGVPLALSGTLHAGTIAAVILVTTLGAGPAAETLPSERLRDDMRLVYIAEPGPGGGGGGGGLKQKAPPPRAKREGQRRMSSPVVRRPPPEVEQPVEKPADPPPAAPEAVNAPVAESPADDRDRIGVAENTPVESESQGPGSRDGAGTGAGGGLGEGSGSGIGPGSGGGTGGGPFRPGSGVAPPRLIREVKPDYTEEARRRSIEGEVTLQVVVLRDGSVGDVRVVRRLGSGLDDKAIQAVRQWKFAPALRQGAPVDVFVEVTVEFKLR
jgi:TonB family protein